MRVVHRGFGWLAIAAVLTVATPTNAHEDGSLHDVLSIMKDRGLIDQGEYEEMSARNAAYEAQRAEDAKPALSFWGDFRFRSENFWYDRDETGNDRQDRHRARYRFRLNAKAEINDHATVLVRLASGDDDPRSGNQTLGSGVDFDTDDFRIDRAYARVSPFAHGDLGENGTLFVEVGKLPNPYVWKRGKDFMLWDGDISLEGASILTTWGISENVELFANAGHYIIDENSTSKDPRLWAGQVGFHAEPASAVEIGARTSYFHFTSLDPAFHLRGIDGTGGSTSAGGNILDGLSGDFGNQDVQVIEASAYIALLTETDWPILFYGTYANNLTAKASSTNSAEHEDTAWGAGVEIGDKKKLVMLGAGFWHIEADAFPSQFIDSNLFDGRTNREGWAAYASREVWKNTDVNLTAFFSNDIQGNVPPYDDSVPDAERIRLQADLVFKFK